MKVLHILDEILYSGAEVMLKNSAHLFIKKNIELHALSTGRNIGVYSSKFVEVDFKIHHIPFRKTIFFFIDIYRLLKKENFDLIHIHTERANFWLSLLANFSGVEKIVRTVHSPHTFKGYLKLKRKMQRYISSHFLGVKFISINSSVQQIERKFFDNDSIVIKNWINDLNFLPAQNEEEKLTARKNWKLF